MKVGDTAYIVESNRYVREVEIRRCSGGMFLVRFTDDKKMDETVESIKNYGVLNGLFHTRIKIE